jgi:hypothetical protein
MLMSRFWYVILSVIVGVATYVVFLAVGQYNRRNLEAMRSGLLSDSQTVEWALKIDARRRLDQLLGGSVNKDVQDALKDASGKDKIPPKTRDDLKAALKTVNDHIAPEYRSDVLFGVDRDGRVVAQIGYDAVAQNDEFELGGYPAVFDALHGFIRDDTWVLGDKMYLVFARPVEFEVAQRPIGAVVGLKELSHQFASDLAKRTRSNVAFYAGGRRISSATGTEGFDEAQLDQISSDMPRLSEDKSYETGGGRSDVRMLSDALGAMYVRLPGDAWDEHAGFAVVRSRVSISGPLGFISGADDRDKSSVPWLIIVAIVLFGAIIGIGLTLLEHTLPLNEMVGQALRLRAGQQDGLQVPRFRGAYRGIAQNVNAGIERIVEKGGGVPRKPADLEQILGPVPAQPQMSAFAFPMDGGGPPPGPAAMMPPGQSSPMMPAVPSAGSQSGPRPHPPGGSIARPTPAVPMSVAEALGMAGQQQRMVAAPTEPAFPPSGAMAGGMPGVMPGVMPGPPMRQPAGTMDLATAPGFNPATVQMPGRPVPPPIGATTGSGPRAVMPAPAPPVPPPRQLPDDEGTSDDEATQVAQIPADVMAAATGDHKSVADETVEWLSVYEDFIRTKKQCGEATDGLTFEKFQSTLKKNRDALIQRHGCKRVRFSVYVKEGRASLKATPVKE